MADKCEARIADFVLNVHDTFKGTSATVERSLKEFYSGCKLKLDARTGKVLVDGREVGSFSTAASGRDKSAATTDRVKSNRGSRAGKNADSRGGVGVDLQNGGVVTVPGSDAPAASHPTSTSGENTVTGGSDASESEEA